ncbi:MAG: 1-acyl-sn-glycerol-3-phosphate acyltransferase [Fusobacteriaceae bacterium]|jgi:1-acyl-sn-glycerol-3-phosphate acyltransferase|nr:1-acyl-sn-glycerol-3-phosphate acyltransferase [Fusobacteriaceae bacterium]
MLGTFFVLFTGLMFFIFITIFYLPVVCLSEKRKGVALARKAIAIVARAVIKSANINLKVIYKDKKIIEDLDKTKGIVYICNHQSNLDIPSIIYGLKGEVGFVAKKEMKNWPFYGRWMKKMNCVFLDRTNPREGLKDMKKAVEIIKDGYPTLIFPEGERSQNGEINQFKKGSFKLAVDTRGIIIPITLKGTFNVQKRGEFVMNRGKDVVMTVDLPIFIDKMDREELKNLDKQVRDIIVKNFED